jgi:Flp pilus assembly protein TadD
MSRKRERPAREPARGPTSAPASDDPVEMLIARARRSRRRGDDRAALVLLRRACALDVWCPRAHALLGVELAKQRRHDEAATALNHARWLRARAGDDARARATARLAESLLPAA